MKRIAVSCFAFLALAMSAAVPQVSNVTMKQAGGSRLVTVTYRLDAPAIVTFDIQTNGTSIGAVNLTNAVGDLNKVVSKVGETCTITWQPMDSWPDHIVNDRSARAVVTAWSKLSPPDYMIISLTERSNAVFYASVDAIPGGVTNRLYKTQRIAMRRIHAAGVRFRMGSLVNENGRDNREIPHDVTFTNDYYMGVYPVTIDQLRRIMGNAAAGSSRFYGCKDWEVRPANKMSHALLRGVDWSSLNPSHAVNTAGGYYIAAFRNTTGIELDLPTEAQWEFACRAGTASPFNDGTSSMDAVGWNSSNWANDPNCTSNETHAVGLLKPNAWGLYDMHGNVDEMCLDWFAGGIYYTDGREAVEPSGPDQSRESVPYRAVRGGNWNAAASSARSAKRNFYTKWEGAGTLGLRFCCPVQFPN